MSEIVIKLEIPGLENLIHAVQALAGTKEVSVQPQMQNIPQQMPQAPIQQAPMQQAQVPVQQPQWAPMQQQVAMQQQQLQPAPMQVPTTAVAQEFTQDQLAVAAAGLVNQGKQPRLIEILRSFGANSLVELQKERYSELAVALRSEGAVI